jgi:glycosyltransferase involved in cell wall biosynthesis
MGCAKIVVTTVPIPISVVVCTRNRLESLQRCVRALCSTKTDHEWELVIVDNGSEDRTSSFLASLPERFGNVSVVATFESKRGLASARNKGVSQARGKIVAFTDDDCYVTADYIDAMISAFATSNEIGWRTRLALRRNWRTPTRRRTCQLDGCWQYRSPF